MVRQAHHERAFDEPLILSLSKDELKAREQSTFSVRGPAEGSTMPKVTFIIDGEPQVVEFEHGKVPYSHHGKPESFLDIAKNFDVPLEHACGGSCACTTCHVIVKEGEQHLSPMEDDEADRLDTAWGLTAQSRLGCQAVISGDVVCELPMYTRNYVQEGGGIQLGKSDRKERKAQEVAP